MLSPSLELLDKMASTEAGLWIENVQQGDLVLATKLKTTTIKSIAKRAQAYLLISVIRVDDVQVRCVGLRVADDPDRPTTTFRSHRDTREHQFLEKLLQKERIFVAFFDELNRHVGYSECSLELEKAGIALQYLTNTNPHYTGQRSELTELALERFHAGLENFNSFESIVDSKCHIIQLNIAKFLPTQVFVLGYGKFKLDEDEGGALEQAAHQLLARIFPQTFRSPQFTQQDGTRKELTDVLSYTANDIFVIQSKALGVISTPSVRNTDKVVRKIEKSIESAIKQLRGTIRQIRSNSILETQDGITLSIGKRPELPINAIVLISEMYDLVDWERIALKLLEASTQDARFQLFDLHELRMVIDIGLTSECVALGMKRRFEIMKTKKTALLKLRFPDEKVTKAEKRKTSRKSE